MCCCCTARNFTGTKEKAGAYVEMDWTVLVDPEYYKERAPNKYRTGKLWNGCVNSVKRDLGSTSSL